MKKTRYERCALVQKAIEVPLRMGLELCTLPFSTPVFMVVFVHTCVLQSVFFFRPRFQSVTGMVKSKLCVMPGRQSKVTKQITDRRYTVSCYLLPPRRQKAQH